MLRANAGESSAQGAARVRSTATGFRSGAQIKKRRGLTTIEKYQICKKRKESKEFEEMRLEDFGQLFPGTYLNTSIDFHGILN